MIPFNEVNLIAVLLGTIGAMASGFVWYSPSVLGKRWMKLVGLSESDISKADAKKGMQIGFVATLLSVYILGLLFAIMQPHSFGAGIAYTFILWLGLILPGELHKVAWEKRSLELVYINVSQSLVGLLIAAPILMITR